MYVLRNKQIELNLEKKSWENWITGTYKECDSKRCLAV